jgi:hypothetical protein
LIIFVITPAKVVLFLGFSGRAEGATIQDLENAKKIATYVWMGT